MKRYPSLMESAAPWIVWITIALLLVAMLIALAVATIPHEPVVFVVAVLLLLLIGCVVAVQAWQSMRLNRQRAFQLMLSFSIERRIPLIPALQAFGAEYWTWHGRTRRLAAALANGMVLADALRLFPGLLPAQSLPLIEAGHQSGRLGEAIRCAAEQNKRTAPICQSLAGKVFYLTVLLLFMAGIWIYMMVWTVPRLTAIFQDFNQQLPWLTRQMLGVTHIMWLWSLPLGLALGGLFLYGSCCYVGLITCDLPGTRWITRRLDTATILDTLAISTEAGRPMPEALTALAARYPKRSIRNRLRHMWFRVAEGRDWCESLLASRLLGPAEAGVLQSAARAGNLPWAMREMADSNRRRFAYRLSAVLQVVFPATLCAIGLAVGLYVIAFFLPLIGLIQHLSK